MNVKYTNSTWFVVNWINVILGSAFLAIAYWNGDAVAGAFAYISVWILLTMRHAEGWAWHTIWPVEYIFILLALVTVGAAGEDQSEAADELKDKEGE